MHAVLPVRAGRRISVCMKNVRITSIPSSQGGKPATAPAVDADPSPAAPNPAAPAPEGQVEEIGGRKGPDPTRYGDWEIGGRCIDF